MKTITEIIEIIENFDKEMSPQLAAHKVLAYMQERESNFMIYYKKQKQKKETEQEKTDEPDLHPPPLPPPQSDLPKEVMDQINQ